MSERKGRIMVRFPSSSRRVRCTLVGEFLAVHRKAYEDGTRSVFWSVTHVKAGRALATEIKTEALALGCARELGRWCKPLLAKSELYREIREKWEAR